MATGMGRMAHRSCSMCPARCLTLALMRNHYERYHKREGNFHVVCQARGCSSVYNNFEGYKTHLRRKHQDILNTILDEENDVPANAPANNVNDHDAPMPTDDSHMDDHRDDGHADMNGAEQNDLVNDDTVRRLNAALLLGTKEIHKLTQRTVDTVIKNTSSIVQNSMELLRGRLSTHLRNAGVEDPGLQDFFDQLMT